MDEDILASLLGLAPCSGERSAAEASCANTETAQASDATTRLKGVQKVQPHVVRVDFDDFWNAKPAAIVTTIGGPDGGESTRRTTRYEDGVRVEDGGLEPSTITILETLRQHAEIGPFPECPIGGRGWSNVPYGCLVKEYFAPPSDEDESACESPPISPPRSAYDGSYSTDRGSTDGRSISSSQAGSSSSGGSIAVSCCETEPPVPACAQREAGSEGFDIEELLGLRPKTAP